MTAPAFDTAPSASRVAAVVTIAYSSDAQADFYAVLIPANAAAPTALQIIAGTDAADDPASATANELSVGTGAQTTDIVLPDNNLYDGYVCLTNAGGESAVVPLVDLTFNTAPSGSVPDQLLTVGEAYTLDFDDYVTDLDLDTLTVTEDVDSPSGLTMTGNVLSGTPDTAAPSSDFVYLADDGIADPVEITVTFIVREVATDDELQTILGGRVALIVRREPITDILDAVYVRSVNKYPGKARWVVFDTTQSTADQASDIEAGLAPAPEII